MRVLALALAASALVYWQASTNGYKLVLAPEGVPQVSVTWYALPAPVLAWVGVKAGQDPALMRGDLHALTLWLGGGAVTLGAIYWFFVHRHIR